MPNPNIQKKIVFPGAGIVPFNLKSLLLDGADEVVDIGDKSDFELDNHSISFWVKKGANDVFFGLMGIQEQSAGGGGRSGIIIRFNNDNTFSYFACISDNFQAVTTSETFTDTNIWNHFVITKNGTSIIIYHNGISIETGTLSSATIDWGTTSTKKTSIGSYWNGDTSVWTTPLNGNMDEVRIWNRALITDEVLSEYNDNKPKKPITDGLISNWRMGDKGIWDGSNWTFPDQKGSNDAVSINCEFADVVLDTP